MTGTGHPPQASPRRALGVWDAISLLVGIVVGTAIFRMPGTVFRSVDTPLGALGLWAAGGALSLAGALCYAELAAAYPRSGGDYEYLSRAYGRWMGLQFAWAQLLVVLTGSVGSMAFAFADYAQVFWALPPQITPAVAVASILAITGTNLLGLRAGTIAQNLLTAGKLVGLGAIIALSAGGQRWGDLGAQAPAQPYDPGLALVFILYAYAGWTHAAYVAAEVDRPRQTLPRALLAGVGSVMALYLAVNLAFVAILGFQAARDSHTPAADAVLLTAGPAAAGLVSLLVMLSALGAINGTILTGAHVLRELGRDEPRLAWLGGSTNVAGTPVRGLLAEAAVALLLVLAVGTASGRRALDGVLAALWLPEIPWEAYHGGFETLVAAAAPLFWLFLLLTGASLFVLRRRDPTRARPFRAPLYPWTPLLFCAACGYMLWMSVAYARGLCLVALAPIVSAGLISATRPR